MNSYFLTLVLKPEQSESDRKAFLESVTKKMGKVGKTDLWGNRELAYPILHNAKGFYAHFEFEADPQAIAPLDRSLKLEEDVLRYLIIRDTEKK